MPLKLHLALSFSNYRKIKDKDKILKEAKGKKHNTYRGAKIRITSNFWKTVQALEWSERFKVFRGKNPPIYNSVPCEITFQKWRGNKDFLKQKLRESVASIPALQEMLKEVL